MCTDRSRDIQVRINLLYMFELLHTRFVTGNERTTLLSKLA